MENMSTDIIKKCPFCGGEIRLMFLNYETEEPCVWDESVGNVFTWFKCYGCDTDLYHDEPNNTPQKMVEWFNTRKPVERIVERLGELAHDNPMVTDNYILRREAIQIVKENLT